MPRGFPRFGDPLPLHMASVPEHYDLLTSATEAILPTRLKQSEAAMT